MKHRRLLAPPDDLEVDSGARGEAMVARIRLWIVLLLTPIPLLNAIEHPHWENLVGMGVIAVALLLAFNIDTAVRRDPRTPGIGIVSTTADVSLITLGLSTFLVYGEPLTATNSMVVFDVYFLAIMSTALRHDPRLSLLAGALAVVQYAIIVVVAVTTFDLMNDGVFSERYGEFSWGTQISRMILLFAAAAVATIIVVRQSELLHRSSVDSLTTLYNRAAFEERLELEVTRSRRHKHALSIAMLDIDHFKHINDMRGHAAGDAALRGLAEALRLGARASDVAGRLGGEEFAVLLPETRMEEAAGYAERLRKSIAATIIVHQREELRFTCSFGVALMRESDDLDALLARADAALYRAKEEGRDRVCREAEA